MTCSTAAPFVDAGDDVRRFLKRNYLAHGIEGGLYIGGLAFVSPQTVLPRMIEQLGGSSWLVALTPALLMLGFGAPGIFVVHRISRLERMHPFILVTGVLQRLPYLLAGLVLLAGATGNLALLAVALTPLVSGLFGGVSAVAWIEFVARCIPENRRSSLWAVRFIIAGLLGLGAGKGVELVLGSFPTATAYGLLHVCAFALMAGSYLIFASIREPRAAQHEQQPERRWVDFLRSNVPTILGDVQIRRYIGARVLMNGIFVFLPFLGIHALQTLGLPDSFLGYLLGAQMAGGLLGNVLGGTLGDRSGARLPMLTSLSVYALLCMWAPFGSTDIEFIVLFAAFGAAAAMHGTSVPTLDLEICPPDRRIACQAVLGMSNLLGILLFSLLAGAIRSVTTSFANLALPALVSICLSVILVYGIREPRRILA